MRKNFSVIVSNYLKNNSNSYFITGDLGYDAFEGLRENLGNRFINAGVAEQNMIGLAAGISYTGSEVFVYSIAPFCVFRCLEQIKIDVCIHNLPVFIVGNGGGYGYGIMGATHHAIEDIACLSCMPNMTCWIPAFQTDVQYCFDRITKLKKPGYLRLGVSNPYTYSHEIRDVNQILRSDNPILSIIVMGPIITNVLEVINEYNNVDLFTVLSIPITEKFDILSESICITNNILIIEEHVKRGGLSEYFISLLFEKKIFVKNFKSLNAEGYPSKTYGSQKFHQSESGLDCRNIKNVIDEMISFK